MSHNHDHDFVKHPRFGGKPQVTGLNPQDSDEGVYISWNAPSECRVSNTAIAANLNLQAPATVPVTHYFDLVRQCVDCNRRFIFFAAEQQHWYEELKFGLNSDCIRCVPCRKQHQGLGRTRQRYEELLNQSDRSAALSVELAECCVELIECDVFTLKQAPRVRQLLNSAEGSLEPVDGVARLRIRLECVERYDEFRTNPKCYGAEELIRQVQLVFPDRLLGDGVSLDEAFVVDDYGTDEERASAKANDPTAKLRWTEVVDHPQLFDRLRCGTGGYNFMDDTGREFYIPAVLVTLLRQAEPDWNQAYTLAIQFEHFLEFPREQHCVLLNCMEYFTTLLDDGDGPLATRCQSMRAKLTDRHSD